MHGHKCLILVKEKSWFIHVTYFILARAKHMVLITSSSTEAVSIGLWLDNTAPAASPHLAGLPPSHWGCCPGIPLMRSCGSQPPWPVSPSLHILSELPILSPPLLWSQQWNKLPNYLFCLFTSVCPHFSFTVTPNELLSACRTVKAIWRSTRWKKNFSFVFPTSSLSAWLGSSETWIKTWSCQLAEVVRSF